MSRLRLEIENLFRARGSLRILEEVSLSLEPEGRLGVLGAEGSGVSALARVLAGLEPPSAGEARLDGADLADPQVRAEVGYAPAGPGLDADRTPRELLRLAGAGCELGTSRLERRLDDLLIALGLEHVGAHAIEHLTTGMRRRLALAYALVPDPSLLVVDQPLTGLGPTERERMREALKRHSRGRLLVLCTSEPDLVEEVCERVLILEDGRVVADGEVDEITGTRGHRYEVRVAEGLPQEALDRMREHEAVGAVRHEEAAAGRVQVWITEPDRDDEVLADLVEAGARVRSFERKPRSLADAVDERLEGSL